MTAVVMYSGGVGSYCAAKRAVARYGADNVTLLFADVQGHAVDDPHVGEDEDTYRFLYAGADVLGAELVVLNEGRTIWEVFRDKRWLGNSRVAQCSHLLKQKPAHEWLAANDPDGAATVVVGIDWTETHRLPKIETAYAPRAVWAPMTEAPYLDKKAMIAEADADGLPEQRLYALGFNHSNCGGGCVKAGQGHFKHLLDVMPERFARWEAEEQALRDYLGKDVAILSEVVDGNKRPLPLVELRRRSEAAEQIDLFDIGACGCFVDEGDDA